MATFSTLAKKCNYKAALVLLALVALMFHDAKAQATAQYFSVSDLPASTYYSWMDGQSYRPIKYTRQIDPLMKPVIPPITLDDTCKSFMDATKLSSDITTKAVAVGPQGGKVLWKVALKFDNGGRVESESLTESECEAMRRTIVMIDYYKMSKIR